MPGVLYMVFAASRCSPRLAAGLVLLVALVPLVILTRWFQVRSQTLFRRTRVASARLIVQFVETMTGSARSRRSASEQRNAALYGELAKADSEARSVPSALTASTARHRADRQRLRRRRDAVRRLPGDLRKLDVGVCWPCSSPPGGCTSRWTSWRCSTTGFRRRRRRWRRSPDCWRSGPRCPSRRGRWLARRRERLISKGSVRLRRGAVDPRLLRPAHPRRADGGAGGPDRRRQVDAGQADRPGSTTLRRLVTLDGVDLRELRRGSAPA